jgi:hypothetical protein
MERIQVDLVEGRCVLLDQEWGDPVELRRVAHASDSGTWAESTAGSAKPVSANDGGARAPEEPDKELEKEPEKEPAQRKAPPPKKRPPEKAVQKPRVEKEIPAAANAPQEVQQQDRKEIAPEPTGQAFDPQAQAPAELPPQKPGPQKK